MRLVAIIAVALELAGIGVAQAAAWTPEKSTRVDALVAQFLTPGAPNRAPPAPALSLAVGIDGQLVLAKGYGEASPGIPATERTVYRIGSLTKQFTAAAILHLIESGAKTPLFKTPMTLDSPASDFFEGVESWTAKDEPPITVRSLLTMTSNLPNFTRRPPSAADPWGAMPAQRLLSELKKLAPSGWPSTFEYSNTSYFLLAQMLEAVAASETGQPASYHDFLKSTLIAKASLTHTGFAGDVLPGAALAQPSYRRRPAFIERDWLKGSGDMVSNAVDLFAWHKALMDGRIITRSMLDTMFSDGGRVTPLRYYGMGWFIEHKAKWDQYSHSGSLPGFTSYTVIISRRDSPTWVSVTLLTNSDGVEGLESLGDALLYLANEE